MAANTSAGTVVSIGTTLTDPTQDTYTPIGEVITIPEFGRVYKSISYNPIGSRGTLKFKGSYDDGNLSVTMAKSSTDAGQQAVLTARDVDSDYNFQIVANDKAAAVQNTNISISVASPGVVTWTAHGLPVGTGVKFTAGTLPTGLTLNTTYYVCSGATLLTNSFTVATSYANAIAGTGITTTGVAGSAITGTSVPSSTTQTFKAKVLSWTTKYDQVDAVTMSTMVLDIKSGSITEVPHLP